MAENDFTDKYTFNQAVTYCGDLEYAGYDDWRLPKPKELLSINSNKLNPSVDTAYFPTPSDYFWTSKKYVSDAGKAWSVNFSEGTLLNNATSNEYYVRCVRGEPLPENNTFTEMTFNNKAVLLDNVTGLVWIKPYYNGHTDAWYHSLKSCEESDYAGFTDWRLPNKNELVSILDLSQDNQFKIYGAYATVWSSSSIGGYAFRLNHGSIERLSKSNGIPITPICVRSGVDIDSGDWGCPDGKFRDSYYRCVSPCDSNPCNSNATCVATSATEYTCECSSGYSWNGTQCMVDCSSTSATPCIDPDTDLIWSKAFTGVTAANIISTCDSTTYGGFSDWHTATISQLRTLVSSCDAEALGPGGTCGVTDNCSDSSCYDLDYCYTYCTNLSKLGDDRLTSSTSTPNEKYWSVFFGGTLWDSNAILDQLITPIYIRCARCASGKTWNSTLNKCN